MAKKRKTNKIAYSSFNKSYIICTRYIDSTTWYYKLCDENGNITNEKELRANLYYSMLNWKDYE